MKHFLYDHTNWGVLLVFNQGIRSRWEATLMRYCILDTNIGAAMPTSPEYGSFNNRYIKENFLQRNLVNGNGGVAKGKLTEINDMYLRKRELAQMMYPIVSLLVDAIFKRSYNILNEFGTPIDDVLAYEVEHSNPELDQYSPGVQEFAKTLNISNLAAYQEMKLEYETAYAIKIRAYAYMKMFQSKLRTIKTQQDADDLYNEVFHKLVTETMI